MRFHSRFLSAFWLFWLLAVGVCVATGSGSEAGKRTFDIPAGAAEKTLPMFSTQAGIELLFPTELAKGLQTNAVKGSWTPSDAADRMLSGTGFRMVKSERNGVFRLERSAKPAPVSQDDSTSVPRLAPTFAIDHKESGDNRIRAV